MNSSLPITIVYSVLIILVVTVIVFTYEMVINKNIEIIFQARPYLYALEDTGELTVNQRNELVDRLEKIGIRNIIISVESEGDHLGDLIEITIKGESDFGWITGFLTHEIRTIQYEYTRNVVVKRVVN